jgi:hypothetical protein
MMSEKDRDDWGDRWWPAPEPWTERCQHSTCSQNYIDTGETKCIQEADANARLIAAAPDLLTALQELMGAMGGEPPTEAIAIAWVQALAAIAHAKGGE